MIKIIKMKLFLFVSRGLVEKFGFWAASKLRTELAECAHNNIAEGRNTRIIYSYYR